MKPIVLRDHEVRRLASAGSVLVVRAVKVKAFKNVHWYRPWPQHPDKWVAMLGEYQHASATCPLGAPGEDRWVRETWAYVPMTAYRCSDGVEQTVKPDDPDMAAVYAAGWERCRPGQWRSSATMPRWASRYVVRCTDVRVGRVQDVTEDGAVAAGQHAENQDAYFGFHSARTALVKALPGNPWCWMAMFERVE